MFLEYNNKSSLRKKYSRYIQGGDTDKLGNMLYWWERRTFTRDVSDERFIVTRKFHKNHTLLSHIMYGRTDIDWFILQYNNIVDDKDFVAGIEILLPSPQRVWVELMNKPRKGKRSV